MLDTRLPNFAAAELCGCRTAWLPNGALADCEYNAESATGGVSIVRRRGVWMIVRGGIRVVGAGLPQER